MGVVDGLRGLVATEALKKGDVAVRVPLDLAYVESRDGPNHWAARLALRLDDDDDPYVAALPTAPDVPTRWFEWSLQNATFHEEILKTKQWRIDQGVDLDKLDLVCSRSLALNSCIAMVPFIDMANHVPTDRGGGFYELVDGHVRIVAGTDLDVGDAVNIDYGDRPVEDFLLHYGFVPDHNPRDTLRLPTGDLISWRWRDPSLETQALNLLDAMPTSLADDLSELASASDARQCTTLRYRIAKKQLLSFAAGLQPSSPDTSAFLLS